MKFNSTPNTRSLVFAIDDVAGTNVNTYPLDRKALALNMGLDIAYGVIFNSVDTKSYDDFNYSKLPQGTYDIVSGQRNITVSEDSEGGEILKIFKVIAYNESGDAYELVKTDVKSAPTQFGEDTGKVYSYDWVGNSLVFDVTPDTTIPNGIKIFYMRNSTYFVEGDTTKEVGLPATLVPGLIDYAAWRYSFKKGLIKKNELSQLVAEWKEDIKEFMSSQSREDNIVFKPFVVNSK